ncbi:MAG: nucleoside triphosphate pyrophosphohydrolase [Geminicoccaceae bacterium]
MSRQGVEELLAVMRRLRDPERGCPWDIEQSFATIAPFTIEEAYEVADAIARSDLEDLEGELGDLLLQVVYHAQMADEAGAFDFNDVVRGIVDKMIERHPHVFGDDRVSGTPELHVRWEERKAAERARKAAKRGSDSSLLADVPVGLPALVRATKLGKRAARVGFDWPDAEPVLAKLDEELAELAEARRSGKADHVRHEVGDILFTVAHLARHLGVDAETALREANHRFETRFRAMEAEAAESRTHLAERSAEELEAAWQRAKARVG